MAGHISQADAESQRLPGYDVFRASHLIYHDEVNRDGGIYQLCLEAFYAFSDSIMISERYALALNNARTKFTFLEAILALADLLMLP